MGDQSEVAMGAEDQQPDAFPPTRRSVVRALGSADVEVRQRAFDTLVRAYWQPVYKYIRLRWRVPREQAEDLTQEFFTEALEKAWLKGYDPARARFRTFLRLCVDRDVAKARRAAARAKRGGSVTFVPLKFVDAEVQIRGAPAVADAEAEEFFRREWVRAVFELAIERLRAECAAAGKTVQFRVFERYDVRPEGTGPAPTYAELAREHGIPETQVTNYLAFARKRLRQHVLEALAELAGSDAEFAAEAREVLEFRA